MNVSEIMSSPVHTVHVDATVVDAANIMLDMSISTLPVVNRRDHLVGIVSHSDFFLHRIQDPGLKGSVYELFGKIVTAENINNLADALSRVSVGDVMTTPVVTVREDTDLSEVVRLMGQRRVKRIPVVRGESVVGIMTRHDFLRLVATGALA